MLIQQRGRPQSGSISVLSTRGLPAGSPNGTVLLQWAATFTNFEAEAYEQGFYGWKPRYLGNPCAWTGIACRDDGTYSIDLSARNLKLGEDDGLVPTENLPAFMGFDPAIMPQPSHMQTAFYCATGRMEAHCQRHRL